MAWHDLNLKGSKFLYRSNSDSDQLYDVVYDDLKNFNFNQPVKILEIGCGIGSVGLALLKKINSPNLSLTGIDIQSKAVEYAFENAKNNNIENVNFIVSDLYENLKEKDFDIIYGNFPYFTFKELTERYPKNNLVDIPISCYIVGNSDNNMFLLNKVIPQTSLYLKSKGYLYFQIGSNEQKEKALSLLIQNNFLPIAIENQEFVKAQLL